MQKLNSVAVIGRSSKKIRKAFTKRFKTDFEKPDFVVTYGGDGTILYAERLYPGIPKIAFRNRKKCAQCSEKKINAIHKATHKVYCESCLDNGIKKLVESKFSINEFNKVEATAFVKKNGKRTKTTLIGLNEVQVHNSNHIHAVRFEFCLNNLCIDKEMIGDGIVVCTAYGSTGYFHAITRKKISGGFGIAFNNSLVKMKPIFLKTFKAELKKQKRKALG